MIGAAFCRQVFGIGFSPADVIKFRQTIDGQPNAPHDTTGRPFNVERLANGTRADDSHSVSAVVSLRPEDVCSVFHQFDSSIALMNANVVMHLPDLMPRPVN